MKVLAINGSPHTNGCTYTAIQTLAAELQKRDIEVELVQLGTSPIQGCIACDKCKETGRCVFDDVVNQRLNKMQQADGIIIGSPVYYSGISGRMKAFLDRFFYCGPDLRFKVGVAVTSLRRSGGVDTFHQLNNFFNLAQVITVPSFYWNCVHGNTPEEVKQGLEGMQIMRTLGRNMAWLLEAVQSYKQQVPPPEQEKRIMTNFIRKLEG